MRTPARALCLSQRCIGRKLGGGTQLAHCLARRTTCRTSEAAAFMHAAFAALPEAAARASLPGTDEFTPCAGVCNGVFQFVRDWIRVGEHPPSVRGGPVTL